MSGLLDYLGPLKPYIRQGMKAVERGYNDVTTTVDRAADPVRKLLGVYVPRSSPTELPQSYSEWENSKFGGPLQGIPRSQRPTALPRNLPAYRGNEKTGGLETLPMARFDARTPLKSDAKFYHGTTTRNGVETINDASKEVSRAYAVARLMGAAAAGGLPSISPQRLAALMLKEGRPDAGMNSFLPSAQADLDYSKKLDSTYHIPGWQKDMLGLVNYTQRVSSRRKLPFETVWNGTGTNAYGQTGSDYARAVEAHRKALLDPRNAEFMNLIMRGYNDGKRKGLPQTKDWARMTDPQYADDPEYKYHKKPKMQTQYGMTLSGGRK